MMRHSGGVLLLIVKIVIPNAGVTLPSGGVDTPSEGVRCPREERVLSLAGVIRPSLDVSVEEEALLPTGTLLPG